MTASIFFDLAAGVIPDFLDGDTCTTELLLLLLLYMLLFFLTAFKCSGILVCRCFFCWAVVVAGLSEELRTSTAADAGDCDCEAVDIAMDGIE